MIEDLRRLEEPGNPLLSVVTASDGYRWHVRRYSPTGPVRGRMVLLHGIQSHGGWYLRSSARIAAAGYAVDFLERRGCGLNTEARGDVPSFRRCLDDIIEFVTPLPRSVPLIVGAISWGGKLGVGLQYRKPGCIDGLALLCPGLFPVIRPPLLQRLWIGRCALRRPTRPFPIPLNDPALFTESPEWRQFLTADPLSLHEATARMLFQSNSLDIYLRRARRWAKAPTLLMLAERDRIIDNRRTRRFVNRLPAVSTIIEYPKAHHTLEFEPDGHPFVDDLLKWAGTVPVGAGNSHR